MKQQPPLDIFLSALPGLEATVAEEARAAGFEMPQVVPGGVVVAGDWSEVWRANLVLRGPGRVLARIARFRAMHPAQLDKRARRIDWESLLRADVPVRVEATCRKSRIYHAGAAVERVARAIAETVGAPITKTAEALLVRVRIEDDLCEISLDSSGEPLHRRGHKQAVGKAPMRETLAALFLRQCGYDGQEPVLDPMCGSGTFPIEAAEIAAGLAPGRDRSFAFESFAGFNAEAWHQMRIAHHREPRQATPLAFGHDRDAGAIAMSIQNAERAGVASLTHFSRQALTDLVPPEGPPGLVITNPPYGARIGNRKLLFALYGTLGEVLRSRFLGWRVGIVTSDRGLARATGLGFADAGPPIPHGGLKINLYRTAPLR